MTAQTATGRDPAAGRRTRAPGGPGPSAPRREWRRALTHLGMSLLALFFLFPLLFMFIGSFKPDGEVLNQGLEAFVPSGLTVRNYFDAFTRAQFGRLFLNSLIVSTAVVCSGLVVNSLFGYALARMRFHGRNVVLAIIIALIIIPLEAIAVPLLFMVSGWGWIDTYHVQILPFVAQPLFIYLFYTFFLDMPRELEEAARIDGAGPLRAFVSVIAPLAKPAYGSVAILSFLFIWGQLLWPVMVTRGPQVRPLPLGIAEFQNLPPIQWGDIMAFAAMMILPVLVVFVAFQRAFVRGVASQGVKG
jgi:multiple sugar transport system permease protein